MNKRIENHAGNGAGGALYFVGFLGAIVFFWQQANGFWDYVIAVFQAIFWPAFLVYELLKFLNVGLIG